MPLDIKAELSKIHELYASDMTQRSFNALLVGKAGTGKSFCLQTCRKPVLIHSFDPGGTKSLGSLIADPKNGIFADTRFEYESDKNPKAFKLWDAEMDRLVREKFFDNIGTYVLDSYTTWSYAILAHIKRTETGKLFTRAHVDVPCQADYQLAQVRTREMCMKCSALPCDFILTAHIASEKDEVTGGIVNTINAAPKLRELLPSLFDEIYVCRTQASSTGVKYEFQTVNDNIYVARSRLCENGKIAAREPQDFKALLKKAGLSAADKPY